MTSASPSAADGLRRPELVERARDAAPEVSGSARLAAEAETLGAGQCERRRFPRWLDGMQRVLASSE